MTNALVSLSGTQGELEMTSEEDEQQEYRRKKEHLLKRVETEQLPDEEIIVELEGRDQVLEQQLKLRNWWVDQLE